MIRIDYIQEFVALASRLSFSRASEELFITQPSLSRHISLLEADLGVKLVERNTRNVYLTPAGTELYRDFIGLLDSYRSLEDHAKALSSGFQGQFRISAPYYWIGKYIEPSVFQFTQKNPGIRIEMNICGPLASVDLLQKSMTDIAMGFHSEIGNTDFLSKQIAREQLCVVMSADHPCAGKESVSVKDFADDPFIILELDKSKARLKATVQQMITNFGISPSRFIFTQNLSTVGLTIRQSGGVSILMNCFGNLGRDYLVSVPLSDPGFILSLYLYRRKECPNEAAVSFFEDASYIDL